MNFNYHISEIQIKCPYCDKNCADDDHIVNGESPTEFECEHCGKKFWASMHYSYDTKSDCELNGQDHVWRAQPPHPRVHYCDNCAQVFVA